MLKVQLNNNNNNKETLRKLEISNFRGRVNFKADVHHVSALAAGHRVAVRSGPFFGWILEAPIGFA